MNHLGELIALAVAVSWTFSAWFADKASHRIGAMVTNVIRLALAAILLGLLLWITTGYPYPAFANAKAWQWLALSALVGYVFGDFCLFNCYLSIGPRFGQLLMTLAPPAAAVAGYFLLGESLSWRSVLAMAVTLSGIAISILSRGEDHHIKLSLPLKGILLGIGAGVGQGVGLVLSKIGMEHYSAALPADAPAAMQAMLPFASTMIRAIVGFAGFFILISIQKGLGNLKRGIRDKAGMKYSVLLTLFGPAFGVSLSLLAVRYADAGIASTLMALTPVMIVVPDVLINKKKPTLRELAGIAVTMLGVALFFLHK
ncbi:MAG: DMT family transporter [Bacteroidales bacterium]|nr:DMT family transporter [Bacteroidales bacterium]